jgi:hypothetical protein
MLKGALPMRINRNSSKINAHELAVDLCKAEGLKHVGLNMGDASEAERIIHDKLAAFSDAAVLQYVRRKRRPRRRKR